MQYVHRPVHAEAARHTTGAGGDLWHAFLRRHKLVPVWPGRRRHGRRRPTTPAGWSEVPMSDWRPWLVVDTDHQGRQRVVTLSDDEFHAAWAPREGDAEQARAGLAVAAARSTLASADLRWIDAETQRRDRGASESGWSHPAQRDEWLRIRALVADSGLPYRYTADPQRPEHRPEKPPRVTVTADVATVLRTLLDAEDDAPVSAVDILMRTGLSRRAILSATGVLTRGCWLDVHPPEPGHPARYLLTERGRGAATARLAERARRATAG
ncbi:hypothetical protein [Saccharothrix sp. HUAS TT1]|uniref:hypothetical protein n=1 Tax=unclassified Saccharothrix TaxID=2593673 RepID=UPI00345C2B38